MSVVNRRNERGVSPQPVGSNELILANTKDDRFGTPIALARDREDRAKSKVCTIAGSLNRPHRPAIAETFASRGAGGTRWSLFFSRPNYTALVKIGTRQTLATLAVSRSSESVTERSRLNVGELAHALL